MAWIKVVAGEVDEKWSDSVYFVLFNRLDVALREKR